MTKSNLAQFGENVVEFGENYVTEVKNVFMQDAVRDSVFGQLIIIAVAVAIAWLISCWGMARIIELRNAISRKTIGRRFVRFVLIVIKNVLFSASAAMILSFEVAVLRMLKLIPAGDGLVLVNVANSVFYGWAVLLVIMHFLREAVGEKFFGPSVRRAVIVTFWALVALQIMGLLDPAIGVLKGYSLPIGSDQMTVWSLIVGIVTVLVTLGFANWGANVCEDNIMRVHTMEMNLRVVFARLCRVGLMVSAVLVALSSAGINLTVLSVFGGAFGVGIGFGMQKIASNYVSGFIILFDRSVKLGDLVEVGGFRGIVTQINTRYSVLKNMADEEMIIPNETFVTNTVKNFSLSSSACVVTVDVSCAYESNVQQAIELFRECVLEQPRVVKNKDPWVIVTEFAASGINLRAGFWVNDPQNGTGGLKSAIMQAVLARYNEAGIEIPYDKQDITLSGGVKIIKEGETKAS